MPYYCAGYTVTSYQIFDLVFHLTKRSLTRDQVAEAWDIAFDELYSKYSVDFQLIEDPVEELILIVCMESETHPVHTRDLLTSSVATHVRSYLDRVGLKPYKAYATSFPQYPG